MHSFTFIIIHTDYIFSDNDINVVCLSIYLFINVIIIMLFIYYYLLTICELLKEEIQTTNIMLNKSLTSTFTGLYIIFL